MKLLKATALAAILAIGTIDANATYDASTDFTVELTTADALSITFNSGDDTISIVGLVDNDEIDADVTISITGDEFVGSATASSRSIVCTLGGSTISDSSSVSSSILDGSTTITTLTFVLDSSCEQGASGTDNTMSISSSAIANSAAGTTYTSSSLTFAAAYVPDTAVVIIHNMNSNY